MKLQIVPLPATADESPYLVVLSEVPATYPPVDCPAFAAELGARGVLTADGPVEVLPMVEARLDG